MSAAQTLADMAAITFREQQLLQAFRAADERGKHAIEDLARQQAEIAQPPTSQAAPGIVVQLRSQGI